MTQTKCIREKKGGIQVTNKTTKFCNILTSRRLEIETKVESVIIIDHSLLPFFISCVQTRCALYRHAPTGQQPIWMLYLLGLSFCLLFYGRG